MTSISCCCGCCFFRGSDDQPIHDRGSRFLACLSTNIGRGRCFFRNSIASLVVQQFDWTAISVVSPKCLVLRRERVDRHCCVRYEPIQTSQALTATQPTNVSPSYRARRPFSRISGMLYDTAVTFITRQPFLQRDSATNHTVRLDNHFPSLTFCLSRQRFAASMLYWNVLSPNVENISVQPTQPPRTT